MNDPDLSRCVGGVPHTFNRDRFRTRHNSLGGPIRESRVGPPDMNSGETSPLREYGNYREFEREAKAAGLEICGDRDPRSTASPPPNKKKFVREFFRFAKDKRLHNTSEGLNKAATMFAAETKK